MCIFMKTMVNLVRNLLPHRYVRIYLIPCLIRNICTASIVTIASYKSSELKSNKKIVVPLLWTTTLNKKEFISEKLFLQNILFTYLRWISLSYHIFIWISVKNIIIFYWRKMTVYRRVNCNFIVFFEISKNSKISRKAENTPQIGIQKY